jgi:hypothetical protein
MANENFYISIPNVYNKDLIDFDNNKFTKAFLKCGEAINQDVDTRLAQEAANAGGMFTIYSFNCDLNKIKHSKKTHFDTVIFGHGDILNVSDKTIWNYCPTLPTSEGRKIGYGQEYMDCSKLLNIWIKNTAAAKNFIDAINDAKEIDEKREIIKKLIKILFECNFNKAVEQFTKSKIVKKNVNLFKHQCLVLEQICYLLNDGKKNLVTQIPCRFGKTLTFLHLFANSPWTVMVVSSYTKTVGNSYTKEINKYDDFKNIQTVNIDDISGFEPTGGQVVIEFPTTGSVDGTIERRIENMRKIVKMVKAKSSDMFLLNEEADYGQHTEKTDEKFEKFMRKFNKDRNMTIISTTGTEAFKAEKLNAFGKFDGKISVNENDWSQIIM